jgi:curved DNA-binding protein CbpA
MSQESHSPPYPHTVLGLSLEADDEEVRVAYLRKVREFPPDRCPVEFERVRDAYELLRDRRGRARHLLFSCAPESPLESLLDGVADERKFVGPEPWLAVLKEK